MRVVHTTHDGSRCILVYDQYIRWNKTKDQFEVKGKMGGPLHEKFCVRWSKLNFANWIYPDLGGNGKGTARETRQLLLALADLLIN